MTNNWDSMKHGINADNIQFNVNGRGKELLNKTIELVLLQSGSKVTHWSISKTSGFVLHWTKRENVTVDYNKFPSPPDYSLVSDIVWNWLSSKEADTVELKGWDSNADHDGNNTLGWRVFCEDWGHVDGHWSAICAIKPAYLWHGK